MNSLQKKNIENVRMDTALSNDQEVSFDDETVLLISLDKNYDNSPGYPITLPGSADIC